MTKTKLDMEQKILGGKLWEEMHRKKYELTMTERAEAIQKYMDTTGKTPIEVAKEMNVTKKEIYRTLTLLKCPEEVKTMIADDRIADDKVSRVIYNLKDKSDEAITEAVKVVAGKKSNSVQVEQEMSELNNKHKIAIHFRKDVRNVHAAIATLDSKMHKLDIKGLRMVGVDAKHLIDALELLLTKVETAKEELVENNKPTIIKKK